MKVLSKLLIVFFMFYSGMASAIVNMENMRAKSDEKTEGFEGQLTLDINGENGNTQKSKAGLGVRGQWYEEKSTRFFVLKYEYGESSDVKDTDKSFFHFRNIAYENEDMAWELFTQLENNKFTRLNLRALIGGGIRFRAIHDDKQKLFLGLGAFRSKEKLDLTLVATDAGVTYSNRLNLYIVYKYAISDHSRFVNTLYYQPDIDTVSDYRLLEQISLQVDITDSTAFKFSVDMAHDSLPPQLIKKTDTRYNTGLEYRF